MLYLGDGSETEKLVTQSAEPVSFAYLDPEAFVFKLRLLDRRIPRVTPSGPRPMNFWLPYAPSLASIYTNREEGESDDNDEDQGLEVDLVVEADSILPGWFRQSC
jgi:hypothetical protein